MAATITCRADTEKPVCRHEGCTTILSVYGNGFWCALHESRHPPHTFSQFIDKEARRHGR